ncbi:MAG: hypothetical protein IM445_12025 [Microcystis sp. M015S1]|uniref:hypothetical protein n=1 Tax=Microcystis sp. M010S1 TaxID=2771101 RepID=UPI0025868DEB|nr:hypothetical protein [Microcystis sp. M010S1]MCA2935439.1 hypothetical protein [Microcystis sp. M015S1]MCA2954613.1 hypothetical protein [Microcystis sp. M010S1]MCA3173075.1 hypothetical protein [Burkholderiales bacterium]
MTDYEQQLQLARERALRYGQQAQYQAPQGRMVGNIYVAPNPLEYLAAGLRSLGGMRGQQMAQEEITQIGSEREKALANALRGFTEKALGRPAEVLPPDVAGPPRPAEPQDMPGAYRALMGAPDAGYRQMAMQGISRIPELEAAAAQRVEDRAFRQQEAETARQARMDQLRFQQESRMAELQARNASAAEQAEMQRQFQREMVELRRSMQPQQQGYYQFIGTPQGIAVGNARTGELSLGTINGQPVIKASDDPTLQGAITGAEVGARKEAEGKAEARGDVRKAQLFLNQLTQAENILKQSPTQSGVGAALDAAGRLIGVSTTGAQQAGKLEALSGWLVANVPRMEGPQSNFDVQNYMTMAGKIGDRTVPVAERLAAVQEIRRLQEKYRDVGLQRLGMQPTQTEQPNAPKNRLRYDAQGNLIP